MSYLRFLLAIGLAWGAGHPERAWIQDSGLAVISAPAAGATLAGGVAITGSASHPQFQRYEVAFAYSPNPTGTWFTLPEPGRTPVVNGTLALWDTTGIADGRYAVRLRVYWNERDYLETSVDGVTVQNDRPSATPAVEATPTAANTPPAIDLPPTATPRPTTGPAPAASIPASATPAGGLSAQRVGQAFRQGIRVTLSAFALLGLYVGVRRLTRRRRAK